MIKTILVPTDFSAAAQRAADYAIELAKRGEFKILLLHVYHLPIPTSSDLATMPIIDPVALWKSNINLLKKEEKRLTNNNSIQVEYINVEGFAVEEILIQEKKSKPDMIVMGMSGAGRISEFLIGSVTTDVVKEAITPVLIVPEGSPFSGPKKIALACDFKIEIPCSVLQPLKDLAKMFSSRLLIVNVLMEKKEAIALEEEIEGMRLENCLQGIPYSFYFPEDKDVVTGLNEFVKDQQLDMVAMIPQKHNLWNTLFKESNTKNMAFHTLVPLLILPVHRKQ